MLGPSDLVQPLLAGPQACWACVCAAEEPELGCLSFLDCPFSEIPHFKEVVIMATICDACGHRTNEVRLLLPGETGLLWEWGSSATYSLPSLPVCR